MQLKKNLLSIGFVFLLVSSALAQNCMMRGGCRKTNENGSRSVDFFLCGDQIFNVFYQVCRPQRRHKRAAATAVDILVERRQSAKFLRTRRSYDIVEECCNEGCAVEEVHEYCDIVVL